VVTSLAAVSEISGQQLLLFVLRCYDLRGSEALSSMEISMGVEMVLEGWCKLTAMAPPETFAIDDYVYTAMGQGDHEWKIASADVLDRLASASDFSSWVAFRQALGLNDSGGEGGGEGKAKAALGDEDEVEEDAFLDGYALCADNIGSAEADGADEVDEEDLQVEVDVEEDPGVVFIQDCSAAEAAAAAQAEAEEAQAALALQGVGRQRLARKQVDCKRADKAEAAAAEAAAARDRAEQDKAALAIQGRGRQRKAREAVEAKRSAAAAAAQVAKGQGVKVEEAPKPACPVAPIPVHEAPKPNPHPRGGGGTGGLYTEAEAEAARAAQAIQNASRAQQAKRAMGQRRAQRSRGWAAANASAALSGAMTLASSACESAIQNLDEACMRGARAARSEAAARAAYAANAARKVGWVRVGGAGNGQRQAEHTRARAHANAHTPVRTPAVHPRVLFAQAG
jgi:hypothetical protein